VQAVAGQLTREFGQGWSRTGLFQMVRFAELFPESQIVQSLTGQLSWTHFTTLLTLEEPIKRDFYAQMCRIECWNTRTLKAKVDGMLFERSALSKKPAALAKQELKLLRDEDRLTPELIFRDPYFLDFLGLKDTYSEKDLESAILREIEFFILELGVGFAFLERQKRVTVDGVDHYLDLLFYHRNFAAPRGNRTQARRFQTSRQGPDGPLPRLVEPI
jgi:predicted nuclease of restriction endonuclease-like (RecB) superfamily